MFWLKNLNEFTCKSFTLLSQINKDQIALCALLKLKTEPRKYF